ncbi:MAG: replication initiator protein A, partial [Oscillospiraceae bacterium]|nr:replication initiator protein A [Oscillospiraceae bacterium]
MKYDYFYAEGSEQFTFYRLPKALFTDEAFACLSCEAKLLYGILLDRMCLSAKNGWTDGEGRVYIIYTVAEIREAMSCSDKKALKMLDELEHGCGLIRRKRQGLGKPNLIYVGNFSSAEGKLMNRNNDTSGAAENTIQEQSEITIQEVSELRCNNTYINKTDNNDTDNNNTDS